MPRAIILGSSGQDGTILFQKLQLLGFEVLGVARDQTRSSLNQFDHYAANICNKKDMFHLVKSFQPDHIYHLAHYRHVTPEDITDDECDILKKSLEVNVLTLHYILEAVSLYSKSSSVFYAGSSHVFGNTESKIQTEETPFTPVDYYGISKAAGINLCRYYRKSNSLSIASGILYNHDSIHRNPQSVSKKIIQGALDILNKKNNELVLGDLGVQIDWGSAHDYVDAMWLLLVKQASDDFIIATGVQHSIKEFVEIVFGYLGLDFRDYVTESEDLIAKRYGLKDVINRKRNNLCGDTSKIQDRVGWRTQTTFKQMVLGMTDHYVKKLDVASNKKSAPLDGLRDYS